MPLTDIQIRKAKAADRPIRLPDGKGLYIEVSPAGGKLWRFKYRFDGKEKRLSLGTYPDVPLASQAKKNGDKSRKVKGARELRDEARELLAQGIDPSHEKKVAKQLRTMDVETFEVVTREWYAKHSTKWAPSHASKVIRRFERDLFPWLGARPIAQITAPEILAVLRRIESRGAIFTAHRAHQNCGMVFRYAVATGRAQSDPTGALRGAIAPAEAEHFASIKDPKAIGDLLRAIDGYKGSFVTKCALQLAPVLFVRPGELRQAEWREINLDACEWRIPAKKMKSRADHIVPLSAQAVAILREIHPLTGAGNYIFPGAQSARRPMSENAVNGALRRLGYEKSELTGHGFRSMASTLLHEQGWKSDVIERQLAHKERNAVKAAYNHAEHMPERRKMMQHWADYLDSLRAGAKVIPIRHTGK